MGVTISISVCSCENPTLYTCKNDPWRRLDGVSGVGAGNALRRDRCLLPSPSMDAILEEGIILQR